MCYIKMENTLEAIKFLEKSAAINKDCYNK